VCGDDCYKNLSSRKYRTKQFDSLLVCSADIDECSDDTNNCDVNFGVCSNAFGNFSCGCVEGFSLAYDFLACIGKSNYFFKHPVMDRELRVYFVRHAFVLDFLCRTLA